MPGLFREWLSPEHDQRAPEDVHVRCHAGGAPSARAWAQVLARPVAGRMGTVLTAVIDSNVLDYVIADPARFERWRRAVAGGRLTLLWSHVTRQEIAQVPDLTKRLALQTAGETLCDNVATGATILGVSILGQSRLSDDIEGFEAHRKGSANNTNDALIAFTAQIDGTTLITNDARMAARARGQGVQVLTPAEVDAELTP